MSNFSITTGPVLPVALPPSTNVSPGNGFSSAAQGANVLIANATGTIQPFTPVSAVPNGVAEYVSGIPLGISLNSGTAGSSIPVATSGLVTGPWNFVIGLPVYADSNLGITQNPQYNSAVIFVGNALSANSFCFEPNPNVEVYANIASLTGSITIPFPAFKFLNISLAAASTLVFAAGLNAGDTSVIAVTQGNNTSFSLVGALLPSNFVQSTTQGKTDILKLIWIPAKNSWYASVLFLGA